MKKLESLQYARAIAAMLVVIDHTVTQFSLYQSTGIDFIDTMLKKTINMGNIGVYVFFAISGYIMSYTTKNKNFDISYAKIFIQKRIKRIYPLYWIYLSIFIALWAIGLAMRSHHYSLSQIICSYILIPYGVTDDKITPPVLTQAWTLRYEMFFYITFAFFIMLGINKKIMPMLLLVFFSALVVISQLNLFPLSELNIFFSNWLLLLFVAGILLEKNQDVITKLLTKTKNHTLWVIATLLILIATYIDKPVIIDYVLSILILIFILPIDQGRKSLLKIGDASYTIYLSHSFIVLAYGIITKNTSSMWICLLAGLITIFASATLGIFLYEKIEKRIHR
ncbi:acyltransferase family protein [Serratia nevei]|uniref:acyltransferase family protein n=1 Tax=Serratia nevei TaxID=2703794 RepID=UPI0011CB8C1F|nr:acyltransferase [Serratia nevei]TXE63528.1 acyltransferase [Serratia nevei]